MGWIKTHTKQIQLAWLAGLIALFGITRLWQLGTLPLGVHIDEAGMAYDAWCLANFGVDRHLKSWPVYLNNFYSGQSSLYAFVCALVFRIGGFGVFQMRLPGVLFSWLALTFGMKLAKRLYPESAYLPLFVGTLTTICPYFIMGSRFGLDCNLMLGASTMFLYFFVTALQTGRTWRYAVSGLTGGILLYSYALTYIALPVFLILSLVYVLWVRRDSKPLFSLGKWAVMALPMGILAFPLILVQVVNYFDLPEMRLGIFTITKLDGYRIGELGGGFSAGGFINALKCLFVGDANLFDSIPGIWNLYEITAMLFVLGLVSTLVRAFALLKRRKFCRLIFPVFWFAAVLALSCSVDMRTYRLNGLFYVCVLLAAEGLRVLLGQWKALVGCRIPVGSEQTVGQDAALSAGRTTPEWAQKLAWLLPVLLCVVYLLGFARFARFYFTGPYTEATYLQIRDFGLPITEGIEFIEEDEELSRKVTYVWERSIYYAISALPHPQDFDVVGDSFGLWNNYWWGSLGEIDGEHNYMVPHGQFPEYCAELVQNGFEEKDFGHYSVYYRRGE